MSSWRQGKAQKECPVFKYKVGKASLSEDGTARGCAADLRGMCRDLIRDQSQRRSPRAVDRVTENDVKLEILMLLRNTQR